MIDFCSDVQILLEYPSISFFVQQILEFFQASVSIFLDKCLFDNYYHFTFGAFFLIVCATSLALFLQQCNSAKHLDSCFDKKLYFFL